MALNGTNENLIRDLLTMKRLLKSLLKAVFVMFIGIAISCLVAYLVFVLLKSGDLAIFLEKLLNFKLELIVLFVIGVVAICIEQYKKENN
jgi:high-affinity Fe2+/Pb2+ permease